MRSFGSVVAGLTTTLGMFALLAWLAAPQLATPAVIAIIFATNLGIFAGALLHILMRDDLSPRARAIWVGMSLLVVPLFSGGAIVYLALGKERTRRIVMGGALDEALHIPRLSTPKRQP